MVQVAWGAGRGSNEPVCAHTVKAGEVRLFVLLCEGSQIPSTNVHWHNDLNTSLPCPGEPECQDHAKPLIWKAYAPVLMLSKPWKYGDEKRSEALVYLRSFNYSNFRRRAVELTQNVADLVDIGKRGLPFIVQRPPNRRNAPLELVILDHPPLNIAQVVNFDPRRVMERAFNVRPKDDGQQREGA